MANYFTLLTPTGLAKVTNAQLTESKVEIARIAIGDSNGINYKPTGTETKLKNEKWRGPVTSTVVDPNNPNWIIVEAVVPASVGGFTLREVALYDVAGDIIAIGNYPDTYKPVEADGSTMDLVLRTIIEVSNASTVTLKVDPNVIIASRKYVDDKVAGISGAATEVQQQLTTHLADLVKHGVYGTAAGTNSLVMSVPLDASITAYPTGMLVAFKNTTANTGAVTLNINGLGAKSIRKANGNTLASGNLKAGGVYQLRYDGVNFMLLGEGGEYGTANASDVRVGKTIGTENGVINGLLDLSKLIAANIREGVTVDGVTGTLNIEALGGKRYADGTITNTGATLDFYNASGSRYNGYYVQISGLGFKPIAVALFIKGNFVNTVYLEAAEMTSGYTGDKIMMQQSNSASAFRVDGNSAYLNNTGFRLPVAFDNKSYNWIAIG